MAQIGIADKTTLDAIKTEVDANLDAKISSRATNSGVWANSTRTLTSAPSPIKSIQRGTTAVPTKENSTDVTISQVNVSKSFINLISIVYKGASSNDYQGTINALLISSDTLRIEHTGSGGTSITGASVSWEVVEFN